MGILSRRLVEYIVEEVLESDKPIQELARSINKTANIGVASWIRSYMHTLRIIGNEFAHEKATEARRPQHMDENDLVIALFCAHRLLDFWLKWKEES